METRPVNRPRIYVCGPISKGDLAHNINQATEAFLTLLRLGFAPFCPHWSCFADGVREGACGLVAVPHPMPAGTTHADWMGVDLPWVEVAHAVLRLPGESVGADMEVAWAEKKGIPVFNSIDMLALWSARR
jgi:hypothetical protein